MAGAGAVQVADLARHPEPADPLLEQLAQARQQIADRVDARGGDGSARALPGSAVAGRRGTALRLRRSAQGCAPSAEACTGFSGVFFSRSK
jgi:hypothetical protein